MTEIQGLYIWRKTLKIFPKVFSKFKMWRIFMAENRQFYVKYLGNQAVGLKTHVLITTTGQWVQNIFTVGDLIQASPCSTS